MIKDMNVDRFVSNPSLLADLCKVVVERLDVEAPVPDVIADSAAMDAQLREIAKTIDRLEKMSVPIPDVLRAEKTRLAAALGVQDAAINSLELLAESLGTVLREIRARLHRRKPQPASSGKPSDGSNPDRLPRSVLRDSIAHALRASGGRASKERVLELVEAELQGRFFPADLVWLEGRNRYSWQNNTKTARAEMVKAGILRNDSPKGVWELNEDQL